MKEKWTKRRGSETSEFTGNETEFEFNDVPVKKRDYEAKVKEQLSEDLFRLLTDARYFASMHWDISDANIFGK